jgi:DNA-directed RNA polymerase subunit H (RpoH/RPB5)
MGNASKLDARSIQELEDYEDHAGHGETHVVVPDETLEFLEEKLKQLEKELPRIRTKDEKDASLLAADEALDIIADVKTRKPRVQLLRSTGFKLKAAAAPSTRRLLAAAPSTRRLLAAAPSTRRLLPRFLSSRMLDYEQQEHGYQDMNGVSDAHGDW